VNAPVIYPPKVGGHRDFRFRDDAGYGGRQERSEGALVLMFLATGCQSVDVQRQTVSMASYLTDMQYGQVMDNLALMADNPDALPHYVLALSSKCTVQYADLTNGAINWDRLTAAGSLFGLLRLDKESASTTANRLETTEWDTIPDVDPVQEILMQGLYRKVLGLGVPPYQEAALENFFFGKPLLDLAKYQALTKTISEAKAEGNKAKTLLTQIQSALDAYRPEYSLAMSEIYHSLGAGWVHVGCKKNVPKEACYVGKHNHTYVWVTPEEMTSLTHLTIAVLDIAGSDLSGQSGRSARGTGLPKLSPPISVPANVPKSPTN
jgi:hypothetical protein